MLLRAIRAKRDLFVEVEVLAAAPTQSIAERAMSGASRRDGGSRGQGRRNAARRTPYPIVDRWDSPEPDSYPGWEVLIEVRR